MIDKTKYRLIGQAGKIAASKSREELKDWVDENKSCCPMHQMEGCILYAWKQLQDQGACPIEVLNGIWLCLISGIAVSVVNPEEMLQDFMERAEGDLQGILTQFAQIQSSREGTNHH